MDKEKTTLRQIIKLVEEHYLKKYGYKVVLTQVEVSLKRLEERIDKFLQEAQKEEDESKKIGKSLSLYYNMGIAKTCEKILGKK